MDKLPYCVCGDALSLERFKHERFDSLGWIARSGERFADRKSAARIVEHNKVRECASTVYPYPVMPGRTFHQPPSSSSKDGRSVQPLRRALARPIVASAR